METHAKKKTPQLYSTMQGESLIQEYSEPPEDLPESTPLVEDPVKLGFQTEMSGPKLCEALASTCGLRRSLDGCLKFWRSGQSRRVRSQAEEKLKKGKSKLREVGC